MRLPYIAFGLALPPIAFSLYARRLFTQHPAGPHPGRDTIATLVPRCTLNRYVDHFYGTWMLRLESVAAKLAGYSHVPGQDYAHGLFHVVSCSGASTPGRSLTVQWTMPGIALRSASWLGLSIPQRGTQTFSVEDLKDGESRLVYTCIEDWKDGEKPGKADWWHRLYMRMIFDQTRRSILSDSRVVADHRQ